MQIEDKRKCKLMVEIGDMDFGTVFREGSDYFIVSDDGCNDGNEYNECCDTIFCIDLEDGSLKRFYLKDKYEIVKAKVVIE